jgi:hypothetical protein
MVTFVNRQSETRLIKDAFDALQNYERNSFLRTPILSFFGVEGIGKTAILEYIEEQCKQQQIRYIHIDTSQNADDFSRQVVQQVTSRYHIKPDEGEDLLQQSLYATKALLEQGTAVMILDRVDATNEALLERIAFTLRDVIHDNKLFVVLASKRGLLLDSERSVSRKLTSLRLKPLDRASCEDYLNLVIPSLDPTTRKYILEWTRGYPLAMEVMTRAVTEHKFNPARPEDQQTIVNLIVKQVIDEKVFARLEPPDQKKYKEALSILSVPRHFNLLIMQELVDHFAPDLKRGSNLAYMRLPGNIKNDTDVLSWNTFKGGFSVDAPIRNIFLLKIRLEQNQLFLDLHRFLANLNKTIADDVTDYDRIRYLCEYLYHSAYVEGQQEFIQTLEQTFQKMSNISFESLESFEAFAECLEELAQDDEFKETLGEQIATVQSLMYQYLAEINRREARKNSGEAHFYHLRNVLITMARNPAVTDLRAAWIPAIRAILTEEPSGQSPQFVTELLDSERLREALGQDFAILAELVAETSSEG